MICFTFLKGVLPIFCWTGHGSEVKRTNCNQVLITKLQNENKKIKKGIRGKSLHWIEHRIFRGKRCIVETALQLAERLVFANFETSASQSFSKKKLLCHYCKSKSSITALKTHKQSLTQPLQVSRDCFVLHWFEDKIGCHGKNLSFDRKTI